MSNKILIAKNEVNALKSTNPNDFIFHSDYDTLKYQNQGIVTVTTDLSNYYHSEFSVFLGTDIYYYRTVETLAHGLTYTPYFAGYLLNFPSTNQAIQAPFAFGDSGFFASHSVFADDTNLYFVVRYNSSNSPTGTNSIEFGYRIFKNDLGI